MFLKFDELHFKTNIGFVASIIRHGFLPSHSGIFSFEINAFDFFEQVFGHAFEGHDDVFLLHKRHFTVNLGEFGLTVCTQVFITETLGDLEVTVESAHHQQLFEQLWGLGQGVKFVEIHAGGHYEVTGTFGGGADQDRCFHFNEILLVQVGTNQDGHFVP